MATLILALTLAICIQGIQGGQFNVPTGYQAMKGKCDYAVVNGKPEPNEQRAEECAAKCSAPDADCASFQFRHGRTDGSGTCTFSPILCNPTIKDAASKAYIAQADSPDVYFMKTKSAWETDAHVNKMVASSQKRRYSGRRDFGPVYYYEGCCKKTEDICDSDKAGEHEQPAVHVTSAIECAKLCAGKENENCASYRMKWANPSNLTEHSGACFLSEIACSLRTNSQEGIATSESRAITYIAVDRIKAGESIQQNQMIDVQNGAERAGATMLSLVAISILAALVTKANG